TPFRISFFGGGTDYPAWYREHGGAVLATSLNKYCYLTVRFLPPFFEHRMRVVYSKIENCQTVDEITHPAARGILKYLDLARGVEVHHVGDLPARSGMGSSSAFTVGLLHALYGLQGVMPGKKRLACEGAHIEQNVLAEAVGTQDQVVTAYGGFNLVRFLESGDFEVHPVTLPRSRVEELNQHLMLFFTGIARTASNIAETYVKRMQPNEGALRATRDLVDAGLSVLTGGGSLEPFGQLLDEGWRLKRSLSQDVSNVRIDEIYKAAREAGATGGKILGAGGGGFLVLFVPPENQRRVRQALSALVHVPFRFETTGSQIIFSDIDEDFEDESLYRARPDDGL
ncbi:MAG TPA: kinase, partial [Thermoanaerobaculia bacterium]|nr:kinase [Thermoanaerobaculia bacterium]